MNPVTCANPMMMKIPIIFTARKVAGSEIKGEMNGFNSCIPRWVRYVVVITSTNDKLPNNVMRRRVMSLLVNFKPSSLFAFFYSTTLLFIILR